jgi:hypothetical protein
MQALRHRNGLPRFRCRKCGGAYTEEHARAFRVSDYLKEARALMAIQLLVEGCSVRTVERVTGIHRASIIELLVIAVQRCETLQAAMVPNVKATQVQADEIWGYIGCKKKTRRRAKLKTANEVTATRGLQLSEPAKSFSRSWLDDAPAKTRCNSADTTYARARWTYRRIRSARSSSGSQASG